MNENLSQDNSVKKDSIKTDLDTSTLNKQDNIQDISKVKKQVLENIVLANTSALKKLIFLDLILALLTTFFFATSNNAYIGFSLYTIIVSAMLYVYLNHHNLVANKSSFLWLVPINLIAFSNALFYTNTHTLNILIVHILFGLMLIKVTNNNFSTIYDLSLLRRIIGNFVPHFNFTGVFLDKVQFTKTNKAVKSNFVHIIIGVIVAIPVIFIVSLLLSNADANFRNIIDNIFARDISFDEYLFKLIYFTVAFVIFLFYSTKIFYTKDFLPKEIKKLNLNSVTASTFLILLNIVYILFLYLQLQYIFTDGLFALPSDFTYSEYARDGFFPTFAVTIINLCLITFIIHFTTIDFSNKVFKINFFIMFTSNILLIFNALNRMYLYIVTYGYTTLRMLPTLALFLVLVLMILLGLYIIKKINFYKYALISFIVFYVIQAYTCNDIVTTSLNFNKFNVTFDDLTLQNNEYVIITADGHVLEFEENIDTYWYYSTRNKSMVEKIPMRHYSGKAISNYYYWINNSVMSEDTYLKIYEDVPFYSKTFFQLVLENIWYE